jgi:hypothetical protein
MFSKKTGIVLAGVFVVAIGINLAITKPWEGKGAEASAAPAMATAGGGPGAMMAGGS